MPSLNQVLEVFEVLAALHGYCPCIMAMDLHVGPKALEERCCKATRRCAGGSRSSNVWSFRASFYSGHWGHSEAEWSSGKTLSRLRSASAASEGDPRSGDNFDALAAWVGEAFLAEVMKGLDFEESQGAWQEAKVSGQKIWTNIFLIIFAIYCKVCTDDSRNNKEEYVKMCPSIVFDQTLICQPE